MDTRENSLRAIVDWVSVTFKACKNWAKITELLGIEKDKFKVSNNGYLGYKKRYAIIYARIFIRQKNITQAVKLK